PRAADLLGGGKGGLRRDRRGGAKRSNLEPSLADHHLQAGEDLLPSSGLAAAGGDASDISAPGSAAPVCQPSSGDALPRPSRPRRRSGTRPKVVGALLQLSGQYKLFGDAVLRGIRLALQGSDIELVVKDTKGDPALAAKAVEELVFDDGAIGILGPLLVDES